jgi:hypothetical protein
MNYFYHLADDNGVSLVEFPILLPLKSVFLHEYGTYRIESYLNDSDGKRGFIGLRQYAKEKVDEYKRSNEI